MEKILGGTQRGLAFVLSAPAGTGKTTLAKMLLAEFDCITASISFTTRQPRVNEVHAQDYHFVSHQVFQEMILAEHFLEHAKVYQDFYGTSKQFIESELSRGRHVLLVIDTQGALQLMKKFDAVFIFIKPPELSTLRQRLHQRKSETNETIEQRLSWAQQEMSHAGSYDYQIVNDDLQTAYTVLKSILVAEQHKNR